MNNPAYVKWKLDQQLRQQQADLETAQSDADTGIADAAAAQSDASDALEDIASLEATVTTVTAQTETLFNSALSQVATPIVQIIPYTGGFQIIWTCTTPGHTLYKRLNGGAWSAYTGSITLSPGDDSEAYATAAGLTDSEIALYSA